MHPSKYNFFNPTANPIAVIVFSSIMFLSSCKSEKPATTEQLAQKQEVEREVSQENPKTIEFTEEQSQVEPRKVHPLMGKSPILDEFLKLEEMDILSVPVEINVFDDIEVQNRLEVNTVHISSPDIEAKENVLAMLILWTG